MFETIIIDEEKKQELLYIEETQYNDVKSKQISPAKFSQTVSAFANASGGDIFIGIEDDTHSKERHFDGFFSVEEMNKYIQVLEALEGLNSNYYVAFIALSDGKYCMQVTIFKTTTIVRATDGVIWVRKSAQNLKYDDPEKIRRLETDKGIFVYENEIVNDSELADAMNSKIYNIFSKNVIPNIDKGNWLRSQRLCRNNKLNVAGALLFMDEPQIVLPKRSGIKIFRYKTTGEGTRETMTEEPLSIEGCAYSQIYEAVRIVKGIIESLRTLDVTFNTINYPETTLHEIITNAVLHRDYSIPKDIQIRIYDNRVEVESPGKLPGHITLKNILSEQFARNPRLVRLINKFPDPPNKDVGEGLNSAFKAMQALRLKQPIIEELDNSVRVIIKHEKLASSEEIVMEYLKTHDEISNRIGREITGIESENIMKRVFWKLRDANMIEMVPMKKGSKTSWRLRDADKDVNISDDEKFEQMTFFDDLS